MRTLNTIFWIFGLALICNVSIAQTTLIGWDFYPPSNDAIEDISIPANNNKTISCTATGAIAYTFAGTGGLPDNCGHVANWVGGSGIYYWQIELNTTGFTNISVSSYQRSSDTGPRDFKVQYRIGAAGVWTDVVGANIVVANNWTTGVLPATILPVVCENQASIYLRWIMTSNVSATGGAISSLGTSRIDDLNIVSSIDLFYRTKATGLWSDTATWEISTTGFAPWTSPAPGPPNSGSRTITIRSGHTVTINSSTSLDETTVNGGGTLIYNSGTINIDNGPGVDLAVNGSFEDSGPNNTVFAGGARWSAGSNATYVKTRNTSAAVWRDNYNGGITNIPFTANWIIRKTGPANPSLVTINMFYPNLTIENFSGLAWTTGPGSTFAGLATTAFIKGDFDIGGTGTSAVTMVNDNTNAQPIVVLGDMIIQAGNALLVNGTGFDLNGNLTVNGVVNYGATVNQRRFVFSGSNPQVIGGTGFPFNLYELIINKIANDVTLNRFLIVDNNIGLFNGNLITAYPINILVMQNNSTVSAVSNNSYVEGPMRKTGDDAYIFPIGKNGFYRPLEISAPAGAGNQFDAEYFIADPELLFGTATAAGVDHVSNCEYWNFNRIVGASNVNVRLGWNFSTSCGVSLLADMRISAWNTALWTNEGNGGTTGNTAFGDVWSAGAVTNYGPITLSSSSTQNPLPVSLIDFSGSLFDDYIELNWTTASEIESDYFEVQRSSDGQNFISLDYVGAAGFSNSILHYRSIDPDPINGLNYYRLKQVDYNGSYYYSNVIKIINLDSKGLAAYIDQINQSLIVDVPDDSNAMIRIFDVSGKLVMSTIIKQDANYPINISQYKKGIYLVQIETEYGVLNKRVLF